MTDVRKIYMYKSDDARGQVDTFIKTSNRKIKKKFDFILRYIADEKNQFKEPYVKHFSIEKYKRLYELRLKAAGMMVRIIFYNIEENIILLNAFIKRDKRDTEQALDYALKLIERLDRSAETPVDYLSEVDVN